MSDHSFCHVLNTCTFSNVPVCYILHDKIKACITDHIAFNVAVTFNEESDKPSGLYLGVSCTCILKPDASFFSLYPKNDYDVFEYYDFLFDQRAAINCY